ncbi:MAG: pseudouridine-5'-phosphate glycosidase [Pyrinomonadaceae bacterium]
MSLDSLLQVSPPVASALAAGKPVVAFESTVIAHGLPRPQNLETAHQLEQVVRDAGVTAATIAVLDGKLAVGLNEDQLRQIAEADDVKKISTRDLPIAVARRWNGATTVAGTIRIAHQAGIKVFSTGGIGGVHRGSLPDVSADLPELARTPMVVVCSGAKIVLDLAATREWLETNGVTVLGYECDEMPAFYSRSSGLGVDAVVGSPEEILAIVQAQKALGSESALLVTVPVPAEIEVPKNLLDRLLKDALSEAEVDGIIGRDLTPFLLSRMAEQSQGATLRANIALLENNARVAADIALALTANL